MSVQDDLFQQLEQIYEKRGTPPVNLINTAFMVQRWLSMNPGAFWPAQSVNQFAWKLPPWAIGAFLYYVVPQVKKAPRSKYIKRAETKAANYDKEILQKISRQFHCGLNHAIQVCELLKAQGVNLKALFGIQR